MTFLNFEIQNFEFCLKMARSELNFLKYNDKAIIKDPES
jgi:hypothetical protein